MKPRKMNCPVSRKTGSAFLVAIGALSVLTIMVLFFSNTRTARRWSTRMMSNESKAEAMAEAAVQVGLRMVGDQMNEAGEEWYNNLRMPGSLQNGGSTLAGDGSDLPMDLLADSEKQLGIITSSDAAADDYLGTLRSLMENGSWTVRLSASIASAAAFAGIDGDGSENVAGINTKPVSVLGNLGRFVDSLNAPADSPVSFGSLVSAYKLNILLPEDHSVSETPDSFTVTKKILFFKIKLKGVIRLKLPVRQTNPTRATDKIEISGYVSLGPFGKIDIPPITLKAYKDLLAEMLESSAPYLPEFSSRGLVKDITGDTDTIFSYSWGDTKIRNFLNGKWGAVSGLPGVSAGWKDDTAVEKTGALRIRAEVFFEPQAGSGRIVQRTLVAERDFKISDMQPVAPEYVFFINNSEDDEIKFIGIPPGGTTATSSVHAVPHDRDDNYRLKFSKLDQAFGSGATDEKTLVPGMIRINGTSDMAIHLFTGGLEEAHTTHYNALMADHDSNLRLDSNNKIDPRFNWLGGAEMLMDTVYLPIPPEEPDNVYNETREGVVKMWEIMKEKLTLNVPTMLFGDYMVEYPLNVQIESNLKQQYSQLSVQAKVKIDGDAAMEMMDSGGGGGPPTIIKVELLSQVPPAEDNIWRVKSVDDDGDPYEVELAPPDYPGPYAVGDEVNLETTAGIGDISADTLDKLADVDKSTIKIKHIRREEPYGIRLMPTTANSSSFNPANPGTRPPALYSDLQYAKKAKYYYETAADFISDIPNRSAGGCFELDGVTFVNNDDISMPAITVKGKGLIVGRLNIRVTGNITRADDDTVFGLIARNGAIMVSPGVSKIEAACYSHECLQNSAGSLLIIDGNLVMNTFDRNVFNSVQVMYNAPACRTTFLSVVRDVGKYDPARYHAVLGKQWSRYEYEKR